MIVPEFSKPTEEIIDHPFRKKPDPNDSEVQMDIFFKDDRTRRIREDWLNAPRTTSNIPNSISAEERRSREEIARLYYSFKFPDMSTNQALIMRYVDNDGRSVTDSLGYSGKERTIKSNIFKIFALSTIQVGDDEVTMLGCFHNTVQALFRGEETFYLQNWKKEKFNILNAPGKLIIFILDGINLLDQYALSRTIHKLLMGLIPEKYRGRGNHPEFRRQGGYFSD